MDNKDINRIKVVLVEKKRTGKWLAEALDKDPATVSKWCTNTAQPSLETLRQILVCCLDNSVSKRAYNFILTKHYFTEVCLFIVELVCHNLQK